MKIAIDGPAASGKSTMAVELARQLGFLFFDTGVMYRAMTLACIENRIPLDEEGAVTALSRRVKIEVRPTAPEENDGRQATVLLDGRDVTWAIRQKEVDASVSIPSKYSGVRHEMVLQQRRVAEQGNIIMAGRDIGTVVLPNADLKIYLTARVEERARRRYDELRERGQQPVFDEVLASMRERDHIDSTRTESPLKAAQDAVIVDSTGLTRAQSLKQLMDTVRARQTELDARVAHAPQRLIGPAKALRSLRKAPAIMRALMGNINQQQATEQRDGPTGWSILFIICHMRDYERVVQQRIQLTLEQDHPTIPPWNPSQAAESKNYAAQNFAQVLAEWADLRDQTVLWLEAQLPDAWARTCLTTQGEATLLDVALNTSMHDIDHLEQVLKCRFHNDVQAAISPAEVVRGRVV